MRDFSKLIFDAVEEVTLGDLSYFESDDNSDDDNKSDDNKSDDNKSEDNNSDGDNSDDDNSDDEVFNIEDEDNENKSKLE